MLPGEGPVVLAPNKSGKWGSGQGHTNQAGIAEGGASMAWPHAWLPGCVLRGVSMHTQGLGAGVNKEETGMNQVLSNVQNYLGSKAWNWKNQSIHSPPYIFKGFKSANLSSQYRV